MIGDRWGVTDAEVASRFACDDLVDRPVLQAWRGVTVRASPDDVWPWVCQIRLAPYSYDLLDNLGRRSPERLMGLPPPQVGEAFTATAGRPQGRILAVRADRELTGQILNAVMSYRLDEDGPTRTRLLLKVVTRSGPLIAPLLSVGDLVMARRQLLNLAALAERSASRR